MCRGGREVGAFIPLLSPAWVVSISQLFHLVLLAMVTMIKPEQLSFHSVLWKKDDISLYT
jgi:hypothetical protein